MIKLPLWLVRLKLLHLKWYWYAATALFFVVLVTALLAALASAPLPSRTDKGAVVLADRLYKTVQNLQQSLNTPSTQAPGGIMQKYINNMELIERHCDGFQGYYAKSKALVPTSDTTAYLAKSSRLCGELSQIASNSRKLYQSTLPFFNIDAKLKRYQTLPLIDTLVRRHDKHAVDTSLDSVKHTVETMDFETQTISLLASVQNEIGTSTQLDYYPNIAQAQMTLLSERQRYWATYGELQSLIDTLRSQRSRYCKNLPVSQSDRMAECQ